MDTAVFDFNMRFNADGSRLCRAYILRQMSHGLESNTSCMVLRVTSRSVWVIVVITKVLNPGNAICKKIRISLDVRQVTKLDLNFHLFCYRTDFCTPQ